MAPVVRIRDPISKVVARFTYRDGLGKVKPLPAGFDYADSASQRRHERALSGKPARPDHRPMASPGRKIGSIAGVHVDGLVAHDLCIQLCSQCAYKFNYRAYHYYKETKQPFLGACDGCRKQTTPVDPATMFVPESLLGVTHDPR